MWGWGGSWGTAYKSMSWSTSRRERAKLGRLDSEPPLLLREWPPETGPKRHGGEGVGREVGGEQVGEGKAERVEDGGERKRKQN